jgi:hypothetical protein
MIKSYDRRAVGNKLFENMAVFEYLEAALAKRNCIHEYIKNRLDSYNARYRSVHFVFRLVAKNIKIRIYKSIIYLSFV